MADDNSGLMAEFEEFLNAKRERESQSQNEEDYEIEIWDESGKGARVRRSHAKPFLQSLGIDIDPVSDGAGGAGNGDAKGGNSPKSGRRATAKQSADAPAGGVARKYFAKPAK